MNKQSSSWPWAVVTLGALGTICFFAYFVLRNCSSSDEALKALTGLTPILSAIVALAAGVAGGFTAGSANKRALRDSALAHLQQIRKVTPAGTPADAAVTVALDSFK
jgi:hypothetical protein